MQEENNTNVQPASAADYDESKIRHLDDVTHIRQRPGMYIGRLGDGSHAEDGIYVLLKETIDNSIDEFNEGFGKRIEVNILDEHAAEVRDYGRGIPLGALKAAVSQLNPVDESTLLPAPHAVSARQKVRQAIPRRDSPVLLQPTPDARHRATGL